MQEMASTHKHVTLHRIQKKRLEPLVDGGFIRTPEGWKHEQGICVETESVSETIVGSGRCCDTGIRLVAILVE